MVKRSIWPYNLLAATVALALLASGRATAQSAWSEPFEVADSAPFSWFPDLAVGPDATVYITWASGDPDPVNPRNETGASDLLRYRERRGGVWSPVNDVLFTGQGGYTVRHSSALSPDGRLYVLVRKQTQIYLTNAPADRAWSARAWSAGTPVSSFVAYYTAMDIDQAGGLHALWSEAVLSDPADPSPACPNCSDLFYRRSQDGGNTWSTPVNLSQTPEGENRPQLKVDPRGHIHAVWDRGVDWYAGAGVAQGGVYRRSDDGGVTWSEPFLFTAGGRPVQQTALAIDGAGNPFVVFRDAESSQIYFQASRNGGADWDALGEIPGVVARSLDDNNLDAYSLAYDGAGRAHLLLVAYKAGEPTEGRSPSLYHLAWDGATWSPAQPVMSNELYPEWPRLVISGSTLHAVWFTRHAYDRYGSENGANYEIWYSTLLLDAPPILAAPTFTPAPTAQPSPTPTPATLPTSTPLLENHAAAPVAAGPPRWEQHGLAIIGAALLLPLALGVVVAGVVLARRHR